MIRDLATGKWIQSKRRLCLARDRLCDKLVEAPDIRARGRVAGLSPHYLLRVFRRIFGETPHDVTRVRIDRAKAALRKVKTVTDTGFDVGFSRLGSFSGLLGRHVGVTPGVYQRNLRTIAPWPT